MPYYDDTVSWAYTAISKDKELAKLNDGKSIVSDDGSTLVYVSEDKICLDIPMTLTNLVSFFQGMRLRYNDGQGTRDIVTFFGADFVDDMQLKCKIRKSDKSEILVDLETLNFIEDPVIASIPQTSEDYVRESELITPSQLEHIMHPKTLSPLQEEMMGHYTRLHHLPIPKLIVMAEAGEIPRHLASLKGRCSICVVCLFGTAHKRPWRSKSKEVIPSERNLTTIPVPKLPWTTSFRHNRD